MKVNLLFFANFKETLECSSLTLDIEAHSNVASLCLLLAARGGQWQSLFTQAQSTVKVSVNQQMADMQTQLSDNDEVAFFPPVTGG